MTVVSGPIQAVSIAGRRLAVPNDTDAERDLGGLNITVSMNGDGSGRHLADRKPWMLGSLTVSVDDDIGDHEFLQSIQNAAVPVAMGVQYMSGAIYSGTGIIVGDIKFNNKEGTATLELSGAGTLTKQ